MKKPTEPVSYAGIKGAEKLAPIPGIDMQRDEGHLGGYITNGAAPGTWCPHVWDWAYHDLGVRSVMDLGCGLGHTAKYFKDLGCRVTGIEASPSALKNSLIPEDIRNHDFTHGPYVTRRSFDLVWSAEFVEHVAEKYSGNFLFTFARATGFVMITYAEPGQGGHHHVNEQPEQYWTDRMNAFGFALDSGLTDKARSLAGDHEWVGKHIRNRGLVFIRA